MQLAAAWSWRLLVVAGAFAVLIFLIIELRLIVIPVLVSVLVAALLVPFVNFLLRHHWPRWLSVLLAIVVLLVVVGGLVFLAVFQIRLQFDELQRQSVTAYDDFRSWLGSGPLQLSQGQLDGYLNMIGSAIQQDSQVFVSGALSIGSTVGHVLAGALIALFSSLFILIDGKGIWSWIVRVFPRRARAAVDGAGQAGWDTLRNFVRVQILVAFIDAVGIGLGAFLLQVPLAIPVAIFVFFGSFIPIVGAVLTGAVAVFIALVFNGWVVALILLGVVLLVQEIEGHVLQPLVMGTAVKVHPLAVVLVVAAGSMLAGIPGALFAVPFAAVLNVMVKYVAAGHWRAPSPRDANVVSSALWRAVPGRPGRRRH